MRPPRLPAPARRHVHRRRLVLLDGQHVERRQLQTIGRLLRRRWQLYRHGQQLPGRAERDLDRRVDGQAREPRSYCAGNEVYNKLSELGGGKGEGAKLEWESREELACQRER